MSASEPLALAPSASTGSSATEPYFVLRIADQDYCILAGYVHEVADYRRLAQLERAPAPVVGVLSTLGGRVPVLDLAARLGLPLPARDARKSVIVVKSPAFGELYGLGLLVEEARDMIEVEAAMLESHPELSRPRERCLSRIAKLGASLMLVLDVDALLSDEERQQLLALASETTRSPEAALEDSL